MAGVDNFFERVWTVCTQLGEVKPVVALVGVGAIALIVLGERLQPGRPVALMVVVLLIVLGACARAGTITAALRAVQDEAHSNVPALGYAVPYAIGNILLTAWGPVLGAMMSMEK